jgi:pSer/pThr/pTyr-binding forkhead associated (FHA) protein
VQAQQSSNQEQGPAIKEDLVLKVDDQQGFIGAPIVRQGTVAVILRNGRVDQVIGPGRQFMFRLPFQKVEIHLVETKIRNLNIVSHGEFLTADHWRVNVSLWISYRVTEPARIAVEYAEPVHALYSTTKDLLGQIINRQDFQTLSRRGRQVVRQEVLNGRSQIENTLGIALTDVRIDDLTLPDRVGAAFDERQVAQMEGEAEQWRVRGKWQDMPDSVRQNHFQEHLLEGSMFVNPPVSGSPSNSQIPAPAAHSLPAGQGQVIDGQAAQTHRLGQRWGQMVVISGAKQGVVFPLQNDTITIGRAQDNHIVLQDPAVSGHHARIERRQEQIAITDLNSSNGTFVKGERIQRATLNGGEVILMGSTQLRFERL